MVNAGTQISNTTNLTHSIGSMHACERHRRAMCSGLWGRVQGLHLDLQALAVHRNECLDL